MCLAGTHGSNIMPGPPGCVIGDAEVGGKAMATLTWLKTHDQARIKASPRVLAQEGIESSFRVAVEQYFQMLSGRAGYEYATLEVVEAAVGLSITPRVALEDRMVTVRLKPEVGDVSGRGANGLPIITRRTSESTVRVRDGQVVVIGGLLQEIARQTETKIPLLGDLPLVGGLFRSKNNEQSQHEVLIFIVPHILDENGGFEGKLILDTEEGRELGAQASGGDAGLVVKPIDAAAEVTAMGPTAVRQVREPAAVPTGKPVTVPRLGLRLDSGTESGRRLGWL
jgi:type II secretory pathway component GspD/PulD (secretin)